MAQEDFRHPFSIENIPFGVASSTIRPTSQCVSRIGDEVVFLHSVQEAGCFAHINGLPVEIFAKVNLNDFAALGSTIRSQAREVIRELWLAARLPPQSMEHISHVKMHIPVEVKDFTDFSCSLDHVQNAGRIVVNNENPPPGFFYYPSAYAGRAGSIVVSGTPIARPWGHWHRAKMNPEKNVCENPVIFAPSQALDYEMEFAAIIGKPLSMGKGLKVSEVDEHVFGFVLVNDWSARDIQKLEMFPLGPCNGKNSATTISPWVITPEALASFKVRGREPIQEVPSRLADPSLCTYDVTIRVEIRPRGCPDFAAVGCLNLRQLYWTPRQMIAHITTAGAPLRSGDLMATGTVSGKDRAESGCLLEATVGGTMPVRLADGTERTFLEDGDEVRLTAIAGHSNSGVGFGECVGTVFPANPFDGDC